MYLRVLLIAALALAPLPLHASISFTNQAAAAGVASPGRSDGGALGDYDGDGWPDLLVVPLDADAPTMLYHNQGDGRFVDQSQALASVGQAASGAFVDYDGDGDLDIYVLYFLKENQLFRNDGATFTRISLPDFLLEDVGAVSAALGDFDGDGSVDLFTAYRFALANQYYTNMYTEGFADQSHLISSLRSGLDSFGAAPFDYDNDGDLDLYVTNAGNPNLLHRNDGHGVFRQVAEKLDVHHRGASLAAFPADYDNDGDVDLYMINVGDEENVLYRNDGGRRFDDVTAPAGLGALRTSLGAAWADYDNDGDLDLVVSNVGLPNVYENKGDGTFADISGSALQDGNLSSELITSGIAAADYDLDGDVDLFMGSVSGPDLLLRNDSEEKGHWLRVQLLAQGSEQTALGTRVVVATADGVQLREHVIAMALGSLYGDLLHFGLGSHEKVDAVTVEWSSGQRQVLEDIAADQVLTLREPQAAADLRIRSVLRPNLAPAWEEVAPEVEVHNAGQAVMTGAVLRAEIIYADRSVYNASRPVPQLAAGESAWIRFPAWMPELGGEHIFSFVLEVDDDVDNNTWERAHYLYPFREVAAQLGVNDVGMGWAGAFADYDNDGDLDMYISNGGSQGEGGRNVLWPAQPIFIASRAAAGNRCVLCCCCAKL